MFDLRKKKCSLQKCSTISSN